MRKKNKHHSKKPDLNRKQKPATSHNPALLFGVHAVTNAILNPKRSIHRILISDSAKKTISETLETALNKGLKRPEPLLMAKDELSKLLPDGAVHQSMIVDAAPLSSPRLDSFCERLPEGQKAVFMILDQVSDPHNVGAILRSACAFGAKALIVQDRNAPDITGTLAKIACGAVEHLPIIRETNLSRALKTLQEYGFTCIGLDERGERCISEFEVTDRTALVMGAEGPGLRRLTAETCDELVKLPTTGSIASLNVSNAAAIALYELIR